MDSAIVWFLIGLGLVLAELAVPGIILVFIGVAAWIVAILDWCGVESFSIQLWVFGLVSVGLLVFA
jgi:membrane protein implicated in regulation of membrane protease activity